MRSSKGWAVGDPYRAARRVMIAFAAPDPLPRAAQSSVFRAGVFDRDKCALTGTGVAKRSHAYAPAHTPVAVRTPSPPPPPPWPVGVAECRVVGTLDGAVARA